MSRKFIISDTHFGHPNCAKWRGFDDYREHDELIIKNWNSVVAPSDHVYLLGDVALGKAEFKDIRPRLNGAITLVAGNHDEKGRRKKWKDLFNEIVYYKEIKYNKTKFVLCHYPIISWNCREYGAIHCFGHVHNNDHRVNKKIWSNLGKSWNCCAEVNNFTPILLDDIWKHYQEWSCQYPSRWERFKHKVRRR